MHKKVSKIRSRSGRERRGLMEELGPDPTSTLTLRTPSALTLPQVSRGKTFLSPWLVRSAWGSHISEVPDGNIGEPALRTPGQIEGWEFLLLHVVSPFLETIVPSPDARSPEKKDRGLFMYSSMLQTQSLLPFAESSVNICYHQLMHCTQANFLTQTHICRAMKLACDISQFHSPNRKEVCKIHNTHIHQDGRGGVDSNPGREQSSQLSLEGCDAPSQTTSISLTEAHNLLPCIPAEPLR